MAAPPKEKTIQRSILRFLNGLPRTRARAHTAAGPYNQSGEPDIDCVVDGLAVKLEVKRRVKRGAPSVTAMSQEAFELRGATGLQAKTLTEYLEVGAVVGVVTSVDDVKKLLAANGLPID